MKRYLLVFISVLVFCFFIPKGNLKGEHAKEELPEMTEIIAGDSPT